MGNTKPIGVAYSDQDISGADTISAVAITGTSTVTGFDIYASDEIGYSAAAQGTVTQATDKSTGVTLNKSSGQITMNGAALADGAAVSFTLTNRYLSSKDVLILNISGGAVADPTAYTVYVSSMGSGSAVITLRNLSATSRSEAVVVNYAIIHGA